MPKPDTGPSAPPATLYGGGPANERTYTDGRGLRWTYEACGGRPADLGWKAALPCGLEIHWRLNSYTGEFLDVLSFVAPLGVIYDREVLITYRFYPITTDDVNPATERTALAMEWALGRVFEWARDYVVRNRERIEQERRLHARVRDEEVRNAYAPF